MATGQEVNDNECRSGALRGKGETSTLPSFDIYTPLHTVLPLPVMPLIWTADKIQVLYNLVCTCSAPRFSS